MESESASQQAASTSLEEALRLLQDPVPRGWWSRLSNWWSGDRIERTWAWLEEAEVRIVEGSDDDGTKIALAVAVQRAEFALPEKDPRRIDAERLHDEVFKPTADPGAAQKGQRS